MAYIHKKTFDIIHTTNIKELLNEEYFEVDDMIALPIQALNSKGYRTLFSCSGHLFKALYEISVELDDRIVKGHYEARSIPELSCYITFDRGIHLPLIPKGFIGKTENDLLTIRSVDEDNTDGFDFFEETVYKMRSLYDWAKSLPDRAED